jgi:hypothetical protein
MQKDDPYKLIEEWDSVCVVEIHKGPKKGKFICREYEQQYHLTVFKDVLVFGNGALKSEGLQELVYILKYEELNQISKYSKEMFIEKAKRGNL